MTSKTLPDFSWEDKFTGKLVAGIDEVGRGPLAGPIVAAAVIANRSNVIGGINDSKKLSPSKRQSLYEQICKFYKYSIAIIPEQRIDEVNILNATYEAMNIAYSKLPTNVDVVLVDGNMKFDNTKYISIIKGDTISHSIAAASIIAKVTRDNIMQNLHLEYPVYNWLSNVGYGSKAHIEAIKSHGLCKYHRKSFTKKYQ